MRISVLIKLAIKCFSISCFHFQKQNPNYIVGPCPLAPPTCTLLKVGGRGGGGPSKNWITWGEWIFLRERRDKLEKGGLCKNGELPIFFTTLQFSSVTFTFLDLQSFELPMQEYHSCSHQSIKVLYQNLVSFVHFWSILVFYKKCWLFYLT